MLFVDILMMTSCVSTTSWLPDVRFEKTVTTGFHARLSAFFIEHGFEIFYKTVYIST